MNRKETAEQLKQLVDNRIDKVDLLHEARNAIMEAINELEKDCANCAYCYNNFISGDYCGYYGFSIPDAGELFCANHQKDIFHLNNEV